MINFFKKKSINRYEIPRKGGGGESLIQTQLFKTKLLMSYRMCQHSKFLSTVNLLIISQTGNVLVNVVSLN